MSILFVLIQYCSNVCTVHSLYIIKECTCELFGLLIDISRHNSGMIVLWAVSWDFYNSSMGFSMRF